MNSSPEHQRWTLTTCFGLVVMVVVMGTVACPVGLALVLQRDFQGCNCGHYTSWFQQLSICTKWTNKYSYTTVTYCFRCLHFAL